MEISDIKQFIIDNQLSNLIYSDNNIRFKDFCKTEKEIITSKLLNLPNIDLYNYFSLWLNKKTIDLSCTVIYKHRMSEQIAGFRYDIALALKTKEDINKILNIINYHKRMTIIAKKSVNHNQNTADIIDSLCAYFENAGKRGIVWNDGDFENHFPLQTGTYRRIS